MTARYGQLSYTSFDAVGSAGGWQVKQTRGDLSPDETQLLVSGVRTVFVPPEQLPAYPTPEQLANLPRRLAYRRFDRDTAGYWHSTPAGTDSTGRPGNVFAHAVLDRAPGTPSRHRPIQLWRSPQWVCPYGRVAVADAGLPDQPPRPGAAVTAASVVDFALDTSTWRLATLFGLLDAVAAAIGGGPPVVLGVVSVDNAAQWIGLVSYLMSPGTARTLSFSTFDRADQVPLALRVGQHLTAVPRIDLADGLGDVVAIDETETLSLGELGGEPHRTASGRPIDVTAWSAMAQVALLDAESARLVLDDIDVFAADVDDTDLHPAWPMAMSVAIHEQFADAATEARAVLAEHSPRGVAADSVAGQILDDMVAAAVGRTTTDAWHAVQQMPDGAVADIADAVYLSRAVADDTWLDQLGPIPVRRRRYSGRPVPAELAAAIRPALAAARGAGPDRVLRIVDLLMRAGIDDELLSGALDADVVAVLRDAAHGPRLIRRMGRRIDADTRLAMAGALLRTSGCAREPAPVGDDVLDWLADGTSAPAPRQLAQARPHDRSWNRAALCGQRCLQLGPREPSDRYAALWWLRVTGSPRLEQAVAAAVWDPAELLAAVGDAVLATAALVPTLLGSPTSPALAELAAGVVRARNDDTAVACAAVRLTEPRDWIERGHVETYQAAYTPHWDKVITAAEPGCLHRDFVVRLLVLAVVADIAGQPYPDGCAVLLADPAVPGDVQGEVVAQVVDLVDGNVLIPTAVLAMSLLRSAAGGSDGVDGLLRRVACDVAAGRGADSDEAAEAVAQQMARISGTATDSALRRYRKMAAKFLQGPPEVAPSGRWWGR